MPGLIVQATTGLVSSASRPFSLFVGGIDIIAPTGSTALLVPLESIRLSEVGFSGTTTLSVDFADPARAYALPARARVRFTDNVLDETLFGGFGVGRAGVPAFGGTGRSTRFTAVDGSSILDRRQVVRYRFPSGMSDRAIVQSLIGRYASDVIGALSDTVAQTQATMPEILIENTSLRGALEQVAGVAGTVTNDLLRRRVYVDPDFRLHYFTDEALAAPYAILDSPSGGGQRAPSDFEYEVDDSRIVNRVYVRGANTAGSGWTTNWASVALYGVLEDVVDAPDSDTEEKRAKYGWAFLNERAYPVVRGSFAITGTTGWHAGQTVTITNAAHGLSAEAFHVAQVDTVFLSGTGTRTNVIHFGERPKTKMSRLVPGGSSRIVGGRPGTRSGPIALHPGGSR